MDYSEPDLGHASTLALMAIQENSIIKYNEAESAHPERLGDIDFKLAMAQYAHAQGRSKLFVHILKDANTYPDGRDKEFFDQAFERKDLDVLTHLITHAPENLLPFIRESTNRAVKENDPKLLSCLISAFDSQSLADNILSYLLRMNESESLIGGIIDCYSWTLEDDSVIKPLVRQSGGVIDVPYNVLSRIIEPSRLIEQYAREECFNSNLLSSYMRMT